MDAAKIIGAFCAVAGVMGVALFAVFTGCGDARAETWQAVATGGIFAAGVCANLSILAMAGTDSNGNANAERVDGINATRKRESKQGGEVTT